MNTESLVGLIYLTLISIIIPLTFSVHFLMRRRFFNNIVRHPRRDISHQLDIRQRTLDSLTHGVLADLQDFPLLLQSQGHPVAVAQIISLMFPTK